MTAYGRHGVLDGEEIKLRAVFTDDSGLFLDSTVLPQVYIYTSSVDADTIQEEIDTDTFTSSLAGPLTPTKISTGFYELIYTVPVDSLDGIWHDVWVGSINSTSSTNSLSFKVINGADVSAQQLLNNEIIIVELDTTIASYLNVSLASDIQLSFLTRLSPFYSSVEMIRMEAGPWLDYIPDATIAMMIQWASQEANFIAAGPCNNSDRLRFARAKFVMYDTILRAFSLPGGFSYQPGGVLGTTKRLGDLSITNGNGAVIARTASGIDINTLGELKKERSTWYKVVNGCASTMPGESFPMQAAVRGKYDPDRRLSGRLWADTNQYSYSQAGVNNKGRPLYGRRGKFFWQSNGPGRGGMRYDLP